MMVFAVIIQIYVTPVFDRPGSISEVPTQNVTASGPPRSLEDDHSNEVRSTIERTSLVAGSSVVSNSPAIPDLAACPMNNDVTGIVKADTGAATQPKISDSPPGVSDSGSGIVSRSDTMERSPPVRDSKVKEVGGMAAHPLTGPTEEARPTHIAQTDSMVKLEKEAAQLPLPRLVTGTGQSLQASKLSPPRQQSDSPSHPLAQNSLPSKPPQ